MEFTPETDLNKVRSMSIGWLNTIPFAKCEQLIMHHPFSGYSVVGDPYDFSEGKFYNIGTDPQEYKYWQEQMVKRIKESTLDMIYFVVNKPYRIEWLTRVVSVLSCEDFSHLFGDAFSSIEFPSLQNNKELLLSYFRAADKHYLMSDEEYKKWLSLPDEINVYRGCAVGQENGLSWTMKRKQAEWFRDRFEGHFGKGVLLKATVQKKDCLAYFDREDEIVVDTTSVGVYIRPIK